MREDSAGKVLAATIEVLVVFGLLSFSFAAFLDRVHAVAPTMTTKAIHEMV